MTTPVLIFSKVEVHARGHRLLGPISARVDTPGITVVMGPNGAGKSLFLSAAHGLLAGHSGKVTWDGVAASASRTDRGFVFQTTPILRRSVSGNIVFPLKARNLPAAEKAERVARALSEARLTDFARKPAAALSGGERKRLDLARAMVTSPDVLLLDEPAANLDPASTSELEKSLRRISDRGVKILISTHDVAQARRLAGDILFIADGALVEQASAAQFFQSPASSAAVKYLKGDL